jgi:predicted DCC family thiol-disulfide oxidoreductase YuxK
VTQGLQSPAELLVVYDGRCAFCRCVAAALLLWDRRHALSAAPYEAVRDQLGAAGNENHPCSWYVLAGTSREVLAAGAGLHPVFSLLPGGSPLAWLTGRFPGAAESAYQYAAARRSIFGRLIPRSCVKLADRVIANRAAERSISDQTPTKPAPCRQESTARQPPGRSLDGSAETAI